MGKVKGFQRDWLDQSIGGTKVGRKLLKPCNETTNVFLHFFIISLPCKSDLNAVTNNILLIIKEIL